MAELTQTNGLSSLLDGDQASLRGGISTMEGADERERAERVMVALQAMLRQERIFYERKCKDYVQNPNVRVKDSLTESEQRIADLERKFSECTRKLEIAQRNSSSPTTWNSSGSSGDVGVTSTNSAAHTTPGNKTSSADRPDLDQTASLPPSLLSSRRLNGPDSRHPAEVESTQSHEKLSQRASSPVIPSHSPQITRTGRAMTSAALHNSSSFHARRPVASSFHASRPVASQPQSAAAAPAPAPVATIIIDDEDVDESVADDNLSGAFSSLDQLILDHARMAVFIRYLMDDNADDSDPDALFFYLLTGIYNRQRGTSTSQIRRFARAIFGLFFADNAPMHVQVPLSILESVDTVLNQKSAGGEALSAVFNDARFFLATEVITKQLARFREKRALGFGSLFGEDELLEKINSKAEETDAIRKLLCPLLTNLAGMDPAFSKVDQNVPVRNAALSTALLTFLEDSGVIVDSSAKSTGKSQKKKGLSLLSRKKQAHVKIIEGHQFCPTHYNSPVYCDFCDGLLWGLGYQGLTCQVCGFNVHFKSACSGSLKGMPCQSDGPEHARKSTSKKHSFTSSSNSLYVAPTATVTPAKLLSTSPNLTSSTLATSGESTSLPAESAEDLSVSPGRSDQAEADPGVSLRTRPRGTQVSRSSGPADVSKKLSATSSVNRTKSLTFAERPMKYRKIGTRHESSGALSNEEPPMRSPSLNDISLESGDGRSSSSPDEGQGPFSPKSDPEMDYNEDLIPWVKIVQSQDADFINKLSQKDVKRQGLIHELIHTEATHLKKLKLILNCFYIPLTRAELIPEDQVEKLFPFLNELIAHHRNMLRLMREKMDPDRFGYVTAISDVFRQTMGPENSKEYQMACSEWVRKNQENQDYIRGQQSSSQRFATFMKTCESTEALHRQPLSSLTSCVMTRLTKYPLLLEGIQKSTLREADEEEHNSLSEALALCKDMLSLVNADVRSYDNSKYLQDISAKLDTRDLENSKDYLMASYAHIDLSLKTLVHHSDLFWRAHRDVIPVHALLLTDLIVLLEYNENRSQYYLRVHGDFGSVIRVNDLHVRSVAVDKKAFYLVDLKGDPPKMYSLKAHSQNDCQRWLSATAEVTEARKGFMPQAGAAAGLSPALRRSTNPELAGASPAAAHRPLPARPQPKPPQVIKHSPMAPEEPQPITASDEEAEEAGSQQEEESFEERLSNADQSISRALSTRHPSINTAALMSGTTERRTSAIEPVLDACIQQAGMVSKLARQLLQPQHTESSSKAVEPVLQPANYQLIEASQQLSLQLASMQTLFLHRERAIATIQHELDELRERSGLMDTASSTGKDEADGVDDPEATATASGFLGREESLPDGGNVECGQVSVGADAPAVSSAAASEFDHDDEDMDEEEEEMC